MPEMMSSAALLTMLPRDLRGELCIADITLRVPERGVTFRMDPGRAFERHGTIDGNGDGWYEIRIADRHRPGDQLTGIAGAWGMRAAEVPDELRGVAGRAWSRAEARPHWRDTLGGGKPKILREWPGPAVTREMTRQTREIARGTGTTCFLCWEGDQPRCMTAPPPSAVAFLSVTPEGAWSLHSGTGTYPVNRHPDATTFAAIFPDGSVEPGWLQAMQTLPSPVRLARGDFPDTGPPTAAPVQRGPARTGDQGRREQGRRR